MTAELNLAAFTFGEEEARVLALAVTELASLLADREQDAGRRGRKLLIVQEKREYLAKIGLSVPAGSFWIVELSQHVAGWDETKRNALLIEVAFASPFAPYEVKVREEDHAKELEHIAMRLGLPGERATQILESIRSARKSHRHIPWAKIAIGSVVGAAVLAAGGYFAAPIIAGYLGGAAGLSGAAAVAHGLALLGGGSLAARGAGMAGGMMMVVSTAATVGGVGFGGGAALWNAGYAAALSEIVKLQVAYREVLLRSHLRADQAATVIERLVRQRDELRAQIAREKTMNDPGADRVEDLEKTERGYGDVTSFRQSRLERAISAASGGEDAPLLDAGLAARLEARYLGSFSREGEADGIDLIASGLAGVIGAAIDLLVVAIPRDVTYLGHHPQRGSWLTKLFKQWSVPADNVVARHAYVPFDAVNNGPRVPGMFPGNHRFMTPGHDPLLGFVVGVFDILRGGRTAIGNDGVLRFDGGLGEPTRDIAVALVLEMLHLLSDVATRAGLPAPLMTALGLLRVGSFGKNERTVADLARYMYLQGYDLRHFLTTCSAPAAMRMMLSGYFLGRRFLDENYRLDTDASARRGAQATDHPRLATMTFYADAVACAANLGKIALYQGNPSAFSYGQWLAVLRSASRFAADRLESPTEVLLDRAEANEERLQARWEEVQKALGLEAMVDVRERF